MTDRSVAILTRLYSLVKLGRNIFTLQQHGSCVWERLRPARSRAYRRQEVANLSDNRCHLVIQNCAGCVKPQFHKKSVAFSGLTEGSFFFIITTDQSVTFLQRGEHALLKGRFGRDMKSDAALLSSLRPSPGAKIILWQVQAKNGGVHCD